MALPFLFVRVLYAILSSFAPATRAFDADGHPIPANSSSSLKTFGPTGSWAVYLIMSVAVEYIVVVIYTVVGIRTPLSKDEPEYGRAPSNAYAMHDAQPFTLAESSRRSQSDELYKPSGTYPIPSY